MVTKKTKSVSSKIKVIHLMNLSHTDFGYTDLPSSAWEYQVNNIRLAMQYIRETKKYPSEARFKWTVESVWVLERFWQEATQAERRLFDKYFNEESIEVTFMPGNMSCLTGRNEWERELTRLSFFHSKYRPRVAMQNDINGLPYGMIDSLTDKGLRFASMNANIYSGGVPIPAPSLFWWRGHDNRQLLMLNGEGYNEGYFYFHPKEWRRGPVPSRHNIWYNPPYGNETFSSVKEDLLRSWEHLNKRLEQTEKTGYPFSSLLLAVTNQWAFDNDLPCRQLSDFIKSWNELGLEPRLVFSTPSVFFSSIVPQLPDNLIVLSGEWCDWWADGIASSPFEISVFKSAQRLNKDFDNALSHFEVSSPGISDQITRLNHDLTFAGEHTWGAYDSVARPYGERTLGNHAQKFDLFYRAGENSKRIQTGIIRQSKYYKPFSETPFFEVFNPGNNIRSGWVEISASALRYKADSVREVNSNHLLPLEKTFAPEWNNSNEAIELLTEIPADVWTFVPDKLRFFVSSLQPGESKRYELIDAEGNNHNSLPTGKYFKLVFDESSGAIKNILYIPLDKYLFDERSENLPGQLIVERPQGKYSRSLMGEKKLPKESIQNSSPKILEQGFRDSSYSVRMKLVQEESFAKRIEQQWDIFDIIPRIEITTTIWMKENLDPVAVYMAFPFAGKSPDIFYDSFGRVVEVGVHQMPNTCGECNTIQDGISIKTDDLEIALSTLDSPLGLFDSISRGEGRVTFKPQTAHFYSMLCQNYWITNFSVLYPAKLVFRHIIECGKAGSDLKPIEGNEFWAYPCSIEVKK
jgi:alpha-mannosidase